MTSSMTGFGLGENEENGLKVTVEARSVNHRYIEVGVKSPYKNFALDDLVRKKVKSRFSRGAFEILVAFDNTIGEADVRINEPLLKGYMKVAQALAQRHQVPYPPSFGDLAQIRDMFMVSGDAMKVEAMAAPLERALDQALDRLIQMRDSEGEHIGKDLAERFGRIGQWTLQIKDMNEKSVQERYSSLKEKMEALVKEAGVDEGRLAQEAALLAERSDISEELVRLDSHLKKAEQILGSGGPMGRKLEFLLQELGRETNTIGSKSYSPEITRRVLDMKSELEKLREQAQNLE
ncbi:MAG: YicC family protein [Nitrospinota bacterium]|nr:YicC family protein [Nitrospinota bacterium]